MHIKLFKLTVNFNQLLFETAKKQQTYRHYIVNRVILTTEFCNG